MKSIIEDINYQLISKFREIGHSLHSHSDGRGGQKRILIILYEKGKITQVELTKLLNIKPGSVSEVIGKLEHKKLVERIPSLEDNRTVTLKITEEGKKVAVNAKKECKKFYTDMLKDLTLEEKTTLLSLIKKVNLNKDSDEIEKIVNKEK